MTYSFSADPARIDRTTVHRWLSEESYWAQGRDRDRNDAAMNVSRTYGVYDDATGEQVAYARVLTDGAFFGWLCDVFVDPNRRGAGAGKLLMAGIIADLEPLNLRRVLLMTADAHGLYEQYGFTPLPTPSQAMIRSNLVISA